MLGSRPLTPALMISKAVPRCDRRRAVTSQPRLVGSPVASGGGRVLTAMSHRRRSDACMDSSPGRRWAAAPADRAPSTLRMRASDGSRSTEFGGRRRAPRSCSGNPHMNPLRGAPVPQSRAVHTPASTAAISAASAVFRGFRPTSLPTATTRDRGRLSLIAAIRQEVLGVSGDPDVGQQRRQVHLVRGVI
jgi:hypothetical protein